MSVERDPRELAEEQVVHGLLRAAEEEQAGLQEERIQRVMRSVRNKSESISSVRSGSRTWTVLWPLAASVLLVLGLVVVFSAGESAYALVESAIAAASREESRRYDMRAEIPGSPTQLRGHLDTRGPGRMLVRLSAHGLELSTGYSGEQGWIVTGGEVRRFDAKSWPRWIRLDQGAVQVQSMGGVLSNLRHGYDLRILAAETLPEVSTKPLKHVVAENLEADSLDPERIDLWIDPDSTAAVRVVIRWSLEHFQAHLAHLGSSMRFDLGDEPPPIELVFDLVESPDFADEWFEPETHVR